MKPMSYEAVKALVARLGVRSRAEYRRIPKHCRVELGLPPHPDRDFEGDGWQGWEEFLDEGTTGYLTYDEAKRTVQRLGITSLTRYNGLTNGMLKRLRLPAQLRTFYVAEWEGTRVFFGLSSESKKRHRKPPANGYCDYETAKRIVAELKIHSSREYAGLPDRVLDESGLPSRPEVHYAESGWTRWTDFLAETKKFPSYEQAKAIVRPHGFTTMAEYCHATRTGVICAHLPVRPKSYYAKSGWVSVEDFLGAPRFVTYDEACRIVRSLGVRSSGDYRKLDVTTRRRHRLPSYPQTYYKDSGWRTWAVFLGTSNGRFLPYNQAKRAAATLGVGTSRQYKNLGRLKLRRLGLPVTPDSYYRDKGWESWPKFLAAD